MRVPRSWKDITIRQYQQYCEISAEDYGSDPEEISTKEIDLLAILCNVNPQYLADLPREELYKIADQTNLIADLNPTSKFPLLIFLRGKMLRPMQNVTRWTSNQSKDWKIVAKWKAGQGIDFNTYAKEKDIIPVMHKLIAIICKWGFRKYNGAKLESRAEFIRNNMSMDVAYPMVVFFWHLSRVSLSVTAGSLAEQMMEILTKNKITLPTPSPNNTHG